MSGGSLSVIDSAYYINKGIFCPEVMMSVIVKKFLAVFSGEVKTQLNVHSIDCKGEGHFPVQSVSYLLYSCLYPSIIKITNDITYTHHSTLYYFVAEINE
jgi:hypothetical protein